MKLRDGVSWCRCGDRTVFLDTEQDRYFSLSERASDAFHAWLCGEKTSPADLERLVRCKVLEEGESGAVCGPPPYVALHWDFGNDPYRTARAWDVAQAALAQRRASRALERSSLAIVLAPLHQEASKHAASACSEIEAQRIGAAFHTTAQFVRTADQCLPRALAAWKMCDKRAIPATLLFGIRAAPFAAHCWVQMGDAVIVGDLEQVQKFTPILSLP